MKLKDQLKIVETLKQKNIDAKVHWGVITLPVRDLEQVEIDEATDLVGEMLHDFGYDCTRIIFTYSQDYIWIRNKNENEK